MDFIKIKGEYNQLIRILLILIGLSMVGYSQVLPYGEPKYFTLNPETVVRHASFTDGNFDILKSIWMNGTKTKNGNQALYFLHFTIGKESTFHALLDKKSFPEECELYLINPTEKSWVGPYRKEYLSREVPNFTGRVNASEILIEFAVPLTKEIKFPVISIQNIPSNSNQLESIPPYIRNPKSTRDDPVILLTGYWPPTNEAVRPFSQNPILNPEGWIGEDWEGFGFDIVSYFPTFFPPDCESCGQGSGDLEVDYQDTSEDWWNIVDSLNPISIITFSRGYINYSWELEFKYYNWQNWIDDFTPPYQPTPSPPDQNSPPNHMRFSSLPMNEIVDAVNASDLGLNSYIDYAGGAGQYLSEFKGFHGVWYKDLMEYEEQTPCYLAGHVHVGGMIDWDTAHEAVLITVRETIQYIQENILSPGDVNQDGSINSLDINMVISHLNGTTELTENQFYYADMDEDSNITFHDVILLVNILLTQN